MTEEKRFCGACGKELVLRTGDKTPETNSRFLTRKFCNYECSKVGRTASRHNPPKYCITCGKELVRQNTKGGVLETATSFKHRRYCNATCVTNRIRVSDEKRPSPSGPIPCKNCGVIFHSEHLPARFCSQKCFGLYKRSSNENAVMISRSRVEATHMSAKKACNRCGISNDSADIVIHHIDENPLNNDPANLEPLCRACHVKHHATVLHKQECQICGKPNSTKWKNVGIMCEKHYERLRLYGSPHLKKNGKKEIVECQD